jgi:hypothetical protein
MVFGFDENMSWLLAISYTSIFSVILDRVMKQKFPFSHPGIEFWFFSHDDYSFFRKSKIQSKYLPPRFSAAGVRTKSKKEQEETNIKEINTVRNK